MNTKTLAAAIIGFLLGGLTVSIAAQLDDGGGETQHSMSQIQTLERAPLER